MTHIHRFFLSRDFNSGEQTMLDADDFFHAVKVLRLKQGDPVEVAARSGTVFAGEVAGVDGEVRIDVGAAIDAADGGHRLIVAQALPRGRKMDLVVEKLSELGVDTLVPVETERSVTAPDADGEKVQRWRRIARAAAGQAKRTRVMELEQPRPLHEWLETAPGNKIVLATEPSVEAIRLGAALSGMTPPVALVVGPESGFTSEETALLDGRGAGFARLGRNVLRTETAALVAAAIVLHHMGEIG